MGDEMDFGGEDGIDALCELLDEDPGGGRSPRSDVDLLLAGLAPNSNPSGSDAHRLADRPGNKGTGGGAAAASDRALSDRTSEALEPDLPEPTLALPPDVVPLCFVTTARFNLKCDLDLKNVAFGIRNAEYNPRKHGSITIRLFVPRTTALLRSSGIVTITGQVSDDELKLSAKKVARLVQKCGYEQQVRFTDYAVTHMMCKADLKFPVRLEALASRWRRNALYEPEFYCGCVFRCRQPKVTYLVTSGGKVMIGGLKKMEDVKEALRRVYSVFYEFRR